MKNFISAPGRKEGFFGGRIYSGFSLIELMVVIAIVAVLAALAVPQYKSYILKSKVSNLYNLAINEVSLLKQNQSTYGYFSFSDTNSFEVYGSNNSSAADSYQNVWASIANYPAATCPGSKGAYYSRFILSGDKDVHFLIMLANKDGVVTTHCTITAYNWDGSSDSDFTVGDCENTRGNVWNTTYTTKANAAMAATTCQ